MARPKVSITLLNGQLGQVAPSNDGVAGLLATGIAATGTGGSIALGETKKIASLAEAEAFGITAAYDTTNTTNVWKTIRDFYNEAGTGAILYINIIAKTNLLTVSCDLANNLVKKLLNDAGGKIRILGVTRVPDGAYTPTFTNQIDADVINAFPKLQELLNDFAAKYMPARAFLDGREFQGNTTSLQDLKLFTHNRVSGVLFTDVASSKNASIGLALGRAAAIAVQRNIGRVKNDSIGKKAMTNGELVTTDPIQNAYLTNQSALIDSLTDTAQDAVHDKGWISARKYASKTGYFFTDDPTATSATDDYNSFARGRVVDKALVIANEIYTEELLDDLSVDGDGRIDAAVIKDFQAKIKTAIDERMTTPGNISRCRVTIDPKQNVLSTGKVEIYLYITPKFYPKEILVKIGFENPANS